MSILNPLKNGIQLFCCFKTKRIYSTHIIIDRNHVIKKVVNTASEMILYLDNENIKNVDLTKSPSPPTPPSPL